MKKNLKKVISAVLSLALVMSSLVAMTATSSAAAFADVKDTASYAEAVNALSALGAIAGYDDGTFLPDNNITRAEVTTMVVAALNMTEDAKAAGATTKFADVNANAAWAAGYVNIGVAQGFISGMSATEFAPSDNVTYAQILTMLTRILGYGDYAVGKGGYPDGYLIAASAAGILSGVAAGANDTMTRAQVAQLIWNAVKAPMLDVVYFSENPQNNTLHKMDGTNDSGWRTVLSDKFDAYVLDVEVTATSLSGAAEDGTVNVKLTNNTQWMPEDGKLVKDATKTVAGVAVGNTDIEDYVFSAGKAIIEYNDDGDWTALYFAPTNKVTKKAIDGSLVRDITGSVNDELNIKKSENTANVTTYKLDKGTNTASPGAAPSYTDGTEVYANGYAFKTINGSSGAADVNSVVDLIKNATGDVTLIKDDATNLYDKILVDYYAIARVSQVSVKDDSVTVTLAGYRAPGSVTNVTAAGTSFTVTDDDVLEGKKIVTTSRDGVAIELSELNKNDVVAIKYNVNGSIDNSKTIDILATTETMAGKYTAYDSDTKEYTIAGVQYEAVYNMTGALKMGNSYSFRLDPFGKLFTYEEQVESKNIAIVEKYVPNGTGSNDTGYDLIQVVTMDGASKTLYIETNATVEYDDGLGTSTSIAPVTAATLFDASHMNVLTSVDATATASGNTIEGRLIEYTLKSSTGKINSLKNVTDYVVTATGSEYNSSTNRLDKSLTSSALVLDATAYIENIADATKQNKVDDYKASSLSSLKDGVEYDAILVNKTNSSYTYVIITRAGTVFTADTNFAVAAANATTDITLRGEDLDEKVYTIKAMFDGNDKAQTLDVSRNVAVWVNGSNTDTDGSGNTTNKTITEIKKGDVFVYTTDADGYINKIAIIYKASAFSSMIATTGNTTGVYKPYLAATGATPNNAFDASEWTTGLTAGTADIQLLFGAVVSENGSSVTIGKVDSASVNVKGGSSAQTRYFVDADTNVEDFTVTDNTKIYSYDMSGRYTDTYAFGAGAFVGFDAVDTDDANARAWLKNDVCKGNVAGATDTEHDHSSTMQFAFLMVVDGTVTNAVVFSNN